MSEEEIIEENIRRYIKAHSTTIKAYTQEYVDKLQTQLQQKENIIKEVREYIKYQLENLDFEKDRKAKMLGAMVLVILDKEVN